MTTTTKKPIDPELVFFLREQPSSAKELARLMGKSETRMREILKQHASEIHCSKNTAGVNIFSLPPASTEEVPGEDVAVDTFEATEEELAQQVDRPKRDDDVEPENTTEPTEVPETTPATPEADGVIEATPGSPDDCPLCGAGNLDQDPAGPAGTYLGEARTCRECHRTYNIHTKEEIKNAPSIEKPKKGKRELLNPQPKINAKLAAVEAAGGKLTYERDRRRWVLALKDKEPIEMTAKEFSVETPETIITK